MHEGQRGDKARLLQIEIVGAHLIGEQHPLIDDGPGGHRGDVELLAMGEIEGLDRVAGPLADHVELALEGIGHGHVAAHADEDLPDHRLDAEDGLAQSGVVAGDVAPAEEHLTFGADCALDLLLARQAARRLLGQKHHSHAVLARHRKGHTLLRHFLAEEGIRDLQQDAGTVAGQRIGAGGAAVGEVLEDPQTLLDDTVALLPLDVGDEPDTTGVVLVGRVVQSLGGNRRLSHG